MSDQAEEAPFPVFVPKQLEDENPMPEGATQEPLRQYSNEARAYHARYAELSEAHDKGEYNACREGCLDLLTEAHIPYYTRIQILQMLSTILAPPAAESCLQDAATILAKMDSTTFQVQLLTRDNEMMQADLEESRGLIGDAAADQRNEAVAGEWDFSDGDLPGGTYYEFDRVLQEQRELGIASARKTEEASTGAKVVVFGDMSAEKERKFEEQISADGIRMQEDYEAQEKVQAQDEEEAARSEARSSNDSTFSRLSPGESMFVRPGTGMGMRSATPGSVRGSISYTGRDSGDGASRGIEAVLSDDAVKQARAHADAGRADLAESEAKLADIAAKLRALKMDGAPES